MDTTLLWIHFHVLGHAYWNSQKIFRVMYKDNFQEWRPHVWQSIKRDYGFGSDVNEDDFFESEDPAIPSTSNSVTNAQIKPRTCTTLSTLEKKVDQVIRMLNKEEEKSSLKEVFKCSICLETCSNLMTSCTNPTGCGRLLGCFICFYKIDTCPLCRSDLTPPKDRKPLIISGLESILGVPEISLASALSQLNAQTTGSDSEDDDLMESLPLAAARVLDQ